MTSFEHLIRRLLSEGVRFPSGIPDRAHNHCHGQLRDTFLVYRQGYLRLRRDGGRRELFNAAVDWEYDKRSGRAVLLHRPVQHLATCWALEFNYTDEGGEGGIALEVSDAVDCQYAREMEDFQYLEDFIRSGEEW